MFLDLPYSRWPCRLHARIGLQRFLGCRGADYEWAGDPELNLLHKENPKGLKTVLACIQKNVYLNSVSFALS